MFAAWELRTANPMLDLRFFRNPRFSAGASAITLVFFALFGTFFLLTQYLQLALGHSALEAGLRTLPAPLTIMLVAPMSSRLVDRFGTRAVVTCGLAIVASALALASTWDLGTSYLFFALTLVVLASGMALSMAPSTTAIMTSLPIGKAGVGSAVNDTTRELGGALGVAVLGSLAASHYAGAVGTIPGLSATDGQAAGASLGAALEVASTAGARGPELALAAREAFVDAMGIAFLLAAGVALGAAVMVARFMPTGRDQGEDDDGQPPAPRPGQLTGLPS